MKPNVSSEEKSVDFWEVYDPEDPYIEEVVIEDCTISGLDAEGIEFMDVIFRNVRFEVAINKMYARDVIFEKWHVSQCIARIYLVKNENPHQLIW